ncbi:hypothetical protein MRX96_016520 [Rhipicephalus microplus]
MVIGFALRGSMCTGQNIAVVKDDGVFDIVNHLVKALLHARLSCIRRQMKNKASKDLPMPQKIGRSDYCAAIDAVNCDDDGMENIEHLGTKKTACLVFCCTPPRTIKRIAAPDGLDCSNDLTGLLDMRCLNGMCKQLR